MSRIYLIGMISFLSSICFSQETLVDKFSVHFAKDIDTLSLTEKQKLIDFFSQTKPYFITDISISGHTDGDGSLAYNEDLARRRTNSIQSILNTSNIVGDIILTKSFGEKKLIAKETDETKKSLNRRVEITINYLKVTTMDELLSTIQPDFDQKFIIEPNIKDIKIKGKKGTEIDLNRHNLTYEDGSPLSSSDKVEINLNEIQTFADQLQANISTESSDGHILESGGMFNLKVESNGKLLKLKDNAKYTATLPNKYQTTDMSVFKGVKDSSGVMKWEVTVDKFRDVNDKSIPRPSVCLDEDKLKNWNPKPRFSEYLVKREFDLVEPTPVARPYSVREPKLNKYYKKEHYFGLFEYIFMSKAKKNAYLQKMHDQTTKINEKKIERYETRLENFESKYKAYLLDQDKYKIKLQAYKDSLLNMYNYINNYKVAYIEKEYSKQLKSKIKLMAKLSQKDSLFIYDLSSYLFSDYMGLVRFDRDPYYCKIKNEFETYIKEHYRSEYSKESYARFLREFRIDNLSSRLEVNITLGNWKRAKDDSVINYIRSKNFELYAKEDSVGYKSNFDNFNIYQASLTNFSWINCDRFTNTEPTMMANYRVVDKLILVDKNQIKSVVIIPSINSCINVYNSNFSIPKYREGELLSYYLDRDKKIMFAKSKVDNKQGLELSLDYKAITYRELVKNLMSL